MGFNSGFKGLNTFGLQLYTKYSSTISLREFFVHSIVSNKSWLTLSLDLSPSHVCRSEFIFLIYDYVFQNNSHMLEEI